MSFIQKPVHDLFRGDTEVGLSGLKAKTQKNVFVNICFQGLNFGLAVISNLLLAKRLTPEDFGLVASVALVTAFLNIFNSGGFAQATISESNITHEKVSALFWINTVIGVVLMSLCIIGSPFIADFFGDARITHVGWLVSLSILFTSFGIQYRAIFLRNYMVLGLNTIDFIALFAGVVCALCFASLGYGYWSIVLGTVVTSALKPLGYFILSGWFPARYFSIGSVSSMLKFSGNVLGFQLVNYFTRNLDNILVGRVLGGAALGHYSFAYKFAVAPIQQISLPVNNALLPALSRLIDNPVEYERMFMRYAGALSVLLIIPMLIISMFGQVVFVIFLGENWRLAGEIFELLALACSMQPITNLTGVVFMSSGRTKQQLLWSLFSSPFVWVVFAITVEYGLYALAAGYLILNLVFTPLCLFWAFLNTHISPRRFFTFFFLFYLLVCGVAFFKLT